MDPNSSDQKNSAEAAVAAAGGDQPVASDK